MKHTLQRPIFFCRLASIAIAIAILAGGAAEMCAQIKPDSIGRLDLRDVALMMVRAERVHRASQQLQAIVRNQGQVSVLKFDINNLASEFRDQRYRTSYLPLPQGSDSVIAHVVLVEHLGTSPVRVAIVVFDRQQRPYRLRGFDSSDFSFLVSRIYPKTGLHRRDKAPEILRLFLELELYITLPTSRLIVDTVCLSTIDSVPVRAPDYRFDTGRLDIEFYIASCPEYSSVGPQLSQRRLWEKEDGQFEYDYLKSWEVDDCWCEKK